MKATPVKSVVSGVVPDADVTSRFLVSIHGAHCIVASTVLERVGGAVQARSHCGTADASRIVIGDVRNDSDTVLIAWASASDMGGSPLLFRVVRNGLVLTEVSSTLYVAADVPSELGNVSSAYVLCLCVRAGELQTKVPPVGAIVSIVSIARWVLSGGA